MKRITYLFLILVALSFCSSCTDLYAGKRPDDYENTKWVSEEPNIYFIVTEGDSRFPIKGRAEFNGTTTDFEVSFDPGSFIVLSPIGSFSYDYTYLEGNCKFYKDKMIVDIQYFDVPVDNLFDFKYDTITFIREDRTSDA